MVATLFVKIEGVEGEAVDEAHEKWIVVNSIGLTISRPSEQDMGAVNSGFGKSKFEVMTFDSHAGMHTVKMQQSAAAGVPWPKVIIHQCKSGDDSDAALAPYIIWVLENAYVQNYTFTGSADDVPTESWGLVYTHISCTYYKTDPTTMTLTKGGDFGWDTGKGKLGGAIES